MHVSIYPAADLFLDQAQAYLEHEEVINGLILGVCFGLQQVPPSRKPFLATVEDDHGLTLAAVMTPPHRLVLYSHLTDPSEAVRALIQQLEQTNWTIPGMQGLGNVSDTFVRLWGKPYHLSKQGLYELREVIQPAYPPGSFRAATSADLDVIAQWVLEFSIEIGEEVTLEASRALAQTRITQGTIYLWENSEPVSMAATVRPIRHGMAVNLVYTPPAHRRQGYATACVARLSQFLLDAGYEFCTLFTDLANPTSNRIYQEIGYVPIGEMNVYHFLTADEL